MQLKAKIWTCKRGMWVLCHRVMTKLNKNVIKFNSSSLNEDKYKIVKTFSLQKLVNCFSIFKISKNKGGYS